MMLIKYHVFKKIVGELEYLGDTEEISAKDAIKHLATQLYGSSDEDEEPIDGEYMAIPFGTEEKFTISSETKRIIKISETV